VATAVALLSSAAQTFMQNLIKRTKQTCLTGTDDNRLQICKFLL